MFSYAASRIMSRMHLGPVSAGALFWRSVRKTSGPLITALGLAISLIAWLVAPETSVPLWIVVVIVALSIGVVAAALDAMFESMAAVGQSLPSVKWTGPPPSAYENAVALLILEQSELFAQGSLVSIYRRTDLYEELIGIGWVVAVQQNRSIQVAVRRVLDSATDVLPRLLQSDASLIRSLLVKPSVPDVEMERGLR